MNMSSTYIYMCTCSHLYCLCVPALQTVRLSSEFGLFPNDPFLPPFRFSKDYFEFNGNKDECFYATTQNKPKPLSPQPNHFCFQKNCILYLSPFTFQCIQLFVNTPTFISANDSVSTSFEKNVQWSYKVRTVFLLSFFLLFCKFGTFHQYASASEKKQRLENRQAGKSRRLLLFSQGFFFSSGFYYLCMYTVMDGLNRSLLFFPFCVFFRLTRIFLVGEQKEKNEREMDVNRNSTRGKAFFEFFQLCLFFLFYLKRKKIKRF